MLCVLLWVPPEAYFEVRTHEQVVYFEAVLGSGVEKSNEKYPINGSLRVSPGSGGGRGALISHHF